MLNNLSSDQFGQTGANTSQKSTNGQSSAPAASANGTTTLITVKGSAPSISTRS